MAETDIEELVSRWMAFQQAFIAHPDAPVSPELDEASDEVLHMPFDAPEKTWRFIEAVIARSSDERILGILAAGPIEDLLSQHGEEFVDRVEVLARRNQKFCSLLQGVWRGTMSDEVWERVQKLHTGRLGH